MTKPHETLLHRWFEEVWNQGNVGIVDELFDAAGIAHGLVGEDGKELRGPAGFKPFLQNFRSAFPDIHIEINDTVVEGDKIAARCTVRGTHAGMGIGLAPTGRSVTFTGMTIVRTQHGKIIEAWNNFDFQGLFQQLS